VQQLVFGFRKDKMMNLKRRLKRATQLMAGLEARAFKYEQMPDEDPSHLPFVKYISDELSLRLLISVWDANRIRLSLMLASASVTKVFHRLDLFFDEPAWAIDRPDVVLSVQLLWLRWNHAPEQAMAYKQDYELSTEHGSQRALEDLDTVGQAFVDSVSTPHALAQCLMTLEGYPCRIKWGGKPGSVDRYIYAAILFLQAGDKQAAQTALDKGLHEYDTPAPRAHLENLRLQKFQARRVLLMREIEAMT
jgi:hypothetical protein